MVGVEPRTSCMLGKLSAAELQSNSFLILPCGLADTGVQVAHREDTGNVCGMPNEE